MIQTPAEPIVSGFMPDHVAKSKVLTGHTMSSTDQVRVRVVSGGWRLSTPMASISAVKQFE